MATKGGPIRQLQVQVRALSRREPDRRRRGIRVPRTARLAQSQSWGSLDRTSFNSIWRRVSIQVSVAASEVPRSSARVTHTKSAALCRPAIQCTTTQSPCHKVRAMMPKTSPQSRSSRTLRAAAPLAKSLHSWLPAPGPRLRPARPPAHKGGAVPAQVGRRG